MKRQGAIAALCLAVTGANAAEHSTFQINCSITPSREIQLSAPTQGVVAEVAVRPGQRVEKGDVIAVLDTDLARSDLKLARQQASFDGAVRAAEAQVENLKKRVERLTRALAKRATSQVDVEAVELELALAEVSLDRQRQEVELAKLRADRAALLVEKATITSPVAGTVGEELISVGENASVPVATLYVTDVMRVVAFVPTQFVDKLRGRSTEEIIVNDAEHDPLTVAFDYGSPLANLSSNTISLYYTLENASVLPGSKCYIKP